jgi:hypothetical protein
MDVALSTAQERKTTLKIISSKAHECHGHAAEPSSRARRTEDEAKQMTYFELEHHWLRLARSYELSEHTTDFTGELTRRLHALRQLAPAIPRVVCPEYGKKMRLALLEPYPVPNTEKETTTFLCDCGETYSYTVAPRL